MRVVILRWWATRLARRLVVGGRVRPCEAKRLRPMGRVGPTLRGRAVGSVRVQSAGDSVGARRVVWEAMLVLRSSREGGRIRPGKQMGSFPREIWRGIREPWRRLRPGWAQELVHRKPALVRRDGRRRRDRRSLSRQMTRGTGRIRRCVGRSRSVGRNDRLGLPDGRVVVGRRGRAGR